MSKVTGRCFCQSIRYEVDGPERYACLCYCTSCQRASGAAIVGWATYQKKSFRLLTGDLRMYSSSPGVTRGHCGQCGSSISYETENRPEEIDLTLNTLDDPNGPQVRAHIWTEDKQPWIVIGDDLPVYERNAG